jgi:hypothetical protein
MAKPNMLDATHDQSTASEHNGNDDLEQLLHPRLLFATPMGVVRTIGPVSSWPGLRHFGDNPIDNLHLRRVFGEVAVAARAWIEIAPPIPAAERIGLCA